jgi:alkaline phosphatase
MKRFLFLIAFSLNFVFFSCHGNRFKRYADWSGDEDPEKWRREAASTIKHALNYKENRNIAKNLILFLGDGMGITTVTAGRIYKGQQKKKNGEEEVTFMESLDHIALSKTYNIDAQTADSAGTATAFLTGVKTRIGVIGVDGTAIYGNCKSSLNANLDSILQWAYKAGKSTGIVTTTRITHATPAGAYANSPHRDWESYDNYKFGKPQYDDGCKDIAAQLIGNHSYINVLFGGGRAYLTPNNESDIYNKTLKGRRVDGRNLVNEWINKMESEKKAYKYLWNATDLLNLDENKYDHVLGLFGSNHVEYDLFRNKDIDPDLVDMTEKAIKILSKNPKGFFLLVEGGRIDHAHHDSKAQLALSEFLKFDDSIGSALNMTSKEDTMITVTADHSHTFTLGGYSIRGNNIYGLVYNRYSNVSDRDGLTYTSLLYANGPGGLPEIRKVNLTDAEVSDPNYIQESAVYLKSETHGGEDVPIYSSGPMSFLFRGTVEQSYIAHAMAYSACIGAYDNESCRNDRIPNYAVKNFISGFTLLLSIFIQFI